MDLLDLLILALRLALVALLYVFLIVVLRASGRGLGMPTAATSGVRSTKRAEPLERLSLIVVEPGTSEFQPGQVIGVRGAATFGRTQSANVVLADSTVSAEHARVERVGRAWLLTDLGSTNGTHLNDAPVRPNVAAPLADGDVLSLGAIRLQVLSH